ncbi:disulfide bond formation protein B [Halobacteriales archaeon QS_4_69_34]|nr:MAG: disulfide bond formation protein B [Halobacteriales archaeon QS_4_69_34]
MSSDTPPADTAERSRARLWLAAATLVASVAAVWSLSLSLVLGLTPCKLCWYQRILMYPLVPVIGIAAFENRGSVYRTVLPLSVPGAGIAAYHSWLQATAGSDVCTIGVGCASVQYRFLGLTVPNLSLIAFVLVSLAMLEIGRRRWTRSGANDSSRQESG